MYQVFAINSSQSAYTIILATAVSQHELVSGGWIWMMTCEIRSPRPRQSQINIANALHSHARYGLSCSRGHKPTRNMKYIAGSYFINKLITQILGYCN